MMLVWFKRLMLALELVGKRVCRQWWLVILRLPSFDFLQIYFLYMDGGRILDCARSEFSVCTFVCLFFFFCMCLTISIWKLQVITYFFYKNLTFTLTQFWFTFQTGFSGQRFYDDWFQSLYNVIFTALPVIMVGLFDKVCISLSYTLNWYTPKLCTDVIKDYLFLSFFFPSNNY